MDDLENDKRYIVYCHTNKINGKKYIGITSSSLKRRCGSNGINYRTCRYFYYAIKKYGWDNFSHCILEENITENMAKYYEKYYIKKYNTLSPNGYNLTDGGEVPSPTKEVREKLSKSNTGKKASDETKAKMSKSRIGHEGYNKKRVWMCDKQTHEKIRLFDSFSEAGKFVSTKPAHSHIGKVCSGERPSAYGYYWERYKEEGDDLSHN